MFEDTSLFSGSNTLFDRGILPSAKFEKIANSLLDESSLWLLHCLGDLRQSAIQVRIKFDAEGSWFRHKPISNKS